MIHAVSRWNRSRRFAVVSFVTVPFLLAGLSVCVTSASAATAKPTAANTGVPAGTNLTAVYGDITVTAAGTTLTNLDVHGFIKVRAANVTIRNSRVHGANTATSNTGLIDANSANVKNLVVAHCDLSDDFPSVWVDGIVGHDYVAQYNHVHNVVDGFGVFNGANPSQDLNTYIQYNYVHDFLYMSPDPNHSDNHTHNDGVQIQGTGASVGKLQVKISGNSIMAFTGPESNTASPYAPSVSGQAIAVTPSVSKIHDVLIDSNWMDGGMQTVTMIPTPKGTGSKIVVSNNQFGTNSYYHKGIRITLPMTITAFGNTYPDGSNVPVATS